MQDDIYVMNADGSNLTRLTSFPGNELHTAWSWDNSKIAFARGRADGSAQVHLDVFVIDANGANGHWASPTPSTVDLADPAWSPDGSRIVGGSVSVYKADGSGRIGFEMAPPHVGTVEFPSFSPDGTRILLAEATAPGRSRNLYLFAGTTFTLVSSHGIGIGASWAPDGKAIVYGGLRGQLYRVNPDGTHRVRLPGSGGFDTAPAYTH